MIRFPRSVLLSFVAIVVALLLIGCASLGGARHIAVVSLSTSHGILALVQDTERSLVCGVVTAPAPPSCVNASTHRAISANLATAWGLEADVERLVRAVPEGVAVPPDVAGLLGKIGALIDKALAALPDSAQKTKLIADLTGK